MNWSLTLGLSVVLLVIAFLRLRTEKTREQVTNWFIVYPGIVVILLYAWFYSHWLELLVAAAASGLIVVAWWVAYGSYLPPPTSDNITVWGQEAKKPSTTADPQAEAANPQAEAANPQAEAAKAQAEVERLKHEKEALERELGRLKTEKRSEQK